MMKFLSVLLLALIISNSYADVGIKRLGNLKLKDTVVLGVEGKDNIVVTDGYIVSSTYAGWSSVSAEVTSTDVTTKDLYSVESIAGEPWLIIKGKPRTVYNIKVSVNGFQYIVLRMPSESVESKDWMCRIDATSVTVPITGKYDEGSKYFTGNPNEWFNNKTVASNEYVCVFNNITENSYMSISQVLVRDDN